jgi:hypothetical protein
VAVVAVSLSRDGEDSRSASLKRPIDRAQLTEVAFGERSHWHQPWRAYLDTMPATRLLDAVGINFNVEPGEAEATARLLAASGFSRARVEFAWDSIDYDDPAKLADGGRIRTVLSALKAHGLRPLILLNAHHQAPGPVQRREVTLVQPAQKGQRTLRLDQASVAGATPGRTGLDRPDGKAADVIFTSVTPDGAVELSKPLPQDMAAGPHPATTLRFAPFEFPRHPDGSRNEDFERTMQGWLQYVEAVTREAREVLGGQEFDVEIWNELSFGSDFLYADRYFDPAPPGEGDVTQELLERTISWIRDPSNGIPRVGISNGFASQTPFAAGSTSPRGLTALSKHPYQGFIRFPAGALVDDERPLDARGRVAGKQEAPGRWREDFVPEYDAFFPEYYLAAIQTETLIRDLAPFTNDLHGTRHGRDTRPRGGKAPEIWVTETGLDPAGSDPSRPGNPPRNPLAGRSTPGDVEHLQAKATTRALVAFVNKGVTAIDFFAAKAEGFSLVVPGFFGALERDPGGYPGDDAGGETMRAVRRLTRALSSDAPVGEPRPLELLSVSDRHGNKQFEGDGSSAHPPLFDREVVGFFPFQVTPDQYVIPVYVMTRSLAKLYKPDAPRSDRTRFDLPAAEFQLEIGGLGPGEVRASASDVLTGEETPVEVASEDGDSLTVELPLTDAPRLLKLERR